MWIKAVEIKMSYGTIYDIEQEAKLKQTLSDLTQLRKRKMTE